MKRVFIASLIVFATLLLLACGASDTAKPAGTASEPASVPSSEPASVPSSEPAPSAIDVPEPGGTSGTGDSDETDEFGIPKQINGYALFADIALMSDPPEGGISMLEAVRLLSIKQAPLTIMPASDKSDFAYRYDGIIDIDGEKDECYEIVLLMKDINGEFSEDAQIGKYAVSTDGAMYVFLDMDGEYVELGD